MTLLRLCDAFVRFKAYLRVFSGHSVLIATEKSIRAAGKYGNRQRQRGVRAPGHEAHTRQSSRSTERSDLFVPRLLRLAVAKSTTEYCCSHTVRTV